MNVPVETGFAREVHIFAQDAVVDDFIIDTDAASARGKRNSDTHECAG